MASNKLRAALSEEGDTPKVDMSPMIDLVFLLLIFFLVNATLIIVRNDPKVKITVASASLPQTKAEGRFVVNIYSGENAEFNKEAPYKDEFGKELSLEQLTDRVKDFVADSKKRRIKPRLHVRADREADVLHIKKVAQAAAAAGLSDVIFANYAYEKK